MPLRRTAATPPAVLVPFRPVGTARYGARFPCVALLVAVMSGGCEDADRADAGAGETAAQAPDATPPDRDVMDAVVDDAPDDPTEDAPENTADGIDRPDAAGDVGGRDDGDGDAGELRARLSPDLCAREAVPLAGYVIDPALAAQPVAVVRLAPLHAIVEALALGVGLDADAEATALRGARAAAATGIATCETTACVVEALRYTLEQRAQLATVITGVLDEATAARISSSGWLGDTAADGSAVANALASLHADLLDAIVERTAGDIPLRELDAIADAAAGAGVGGRFDAIDASIARGFMAAAEREEPLRYGLYARDENGPARARAADLDWDAWPWTAIVVPGQGPTDDVTALSPLGRERTALGAARWHAGLAPFVVVSGGHVHPDRTEFSEAIEMRRALIDELGVPADAVVVEPYARHTTTNLRNVARVLADLGAPLDRPVLVTTDPFQAVYIFAGIEQRSRDELGFVPWRSNQKLDENDLCVHLTDRSFRMDSRDPLDP